MSDKVKLIIEIDKDRYNKIINNAKYACPTGLDSIIANGIPLDSVKARIMDNAFKDANETGFIFIGRLWRIFDNIGKESEDKYGNNTK